MNPRAGCAPVRTGSGSVSERNRKSQEGVRLWQRTQGAALDRKKLMGDPIHGHDHRGADRIPDACSFSTRWPSCWWIALSADSRSELRCLQAHFPDGARLPHAITNTLNVGFLVGILSSAGGSAVCLRGGVRQAWSQIHRADCSRSSPCCRSCPRRSCSSLSMIMLFGKAGLITRFLLKHVR